MKQAVIKMIGLYRKYLSAYVLRSCRFHPSCSEYAIDAIEKYGLFSGLARSSWRVLRCNPLSSGGSDPA